LAARITWRAGGIMDGPCRSIIDAGVRETDYRCSHHITMSGDRWPDEVRLSDLEPRFACQACGQRGADVRPNFDWEQKARRTKAGTINA
jgi:hypothetical protein